jgi:hypothetical protein
MAHDDVKLRYEENAKVAAVFFDWRHRLMTFAFTAISALVIVCGWLVSHRAPRGLVITPLAIAGLLSFAAIFMDRRLGEIMKGTYEAGRDLEWELAGGGPAVGAYSMLWDLATEKAWGRLSRILPVVYGAVTIGMIALIAVEAFHPLHSVK